MEYEEKIRQKELRKQAEEEAKKQAEEEELKRKVCFILYLFIYRKRKKN